MYTKLWKLYNELCTRSKRCLMIDLYSILFIILPSKYFLSKFRGSLWILSLVYLIYTVKGNKEIIINDNKLLHIIKKNKYSVI